VIWLRSLRAVAAALLVAAVIGLLQSAEAAAWWLAASLAFLGLAKAFYLDRLHHWAALPRNRDLPSAPGAWGLVFDRLVRFSRNEAATRNELSAELEQVHAAVDRLPAGLIVLDRFDHVRWCNNAAAELHGIFGSGRPIHHFIRQPEFVAYLEGGEFQKPPVLRLESQPGRQFELRLYRTEDGGKLLTTRDITEQAKLDAMRRDFVANVSHEIRTPVTVIGGFAETLLSLDLDDDTRREYLGTILRQSQTMQRLVDDLLTLSSLENSTATPEESRIDLHTMVNGLADEARVLSQGRHQISVQVDPQATVWGAANELESAVRNLLTNAVRYTPEGGRIDVAWRIRDGEGWLTVRDTGIGIAPEHLPRLAERFYRVDRGRSRDSGGTGLGLAITKHVLQRHGGQLHVESRPGVGSAFSLRLPASRVLPATSAEVPAPAAPVPEGGAAREDAAAGGAPAPRVPASEA
jgi:two-component system phosphate regulon sensor histidine kinase PhoR